MTSTLEFLLWETLEYENSLLFSSHENCESAPWEIMGKGKNWELGKEMGEKPSWSRDFPPRCRLGETKAGRGGAGWTADVLPLRLHSRAETPAPAGKGSPSALPGGLNKGHRGLSHSEHVHSTSLGLGEAQEAGIDNSES